VSYLDDLDWRSASRSQVSWLFVRESIVRLGLGLALGVGGAIAAGQLLQGVLVRTSALDLATFAVVVALLATVALLACLIPAKRASALDPAVALRRD
jgi:putative ABC transport system permease protein